MIHRPRVNLTREADPELARPRPPPTWSHQVWTRLLRPFHAIPGIRWRVPASIVGWAVVPGTRQPGEAGSVRTDGIHIDITGIAVPKRPPLECNPRGSSRGPSAPDPRMIEEGRAASGD
jgi:hypothetical protein